MTIENEMERLGKILAADQGIEVECRGVSAYATPGRIVLPAIEHFAYLGDDAERMLHGLLDHEAGHAVDSDFSVVESIVKAGKPDGATDDTALDPVAKVRKGLHNDIEDGYVEGRRALLYKGCAHNLSRKNTWFWTRKDPSDPKARTVAERIAQAANPFSVVGLAITAVVRPHGGRTIGEVTEINPAVGDLLRIVAPELAEVATLYGKTRQSKHCLDITDRIITKLNKAAKESGEEMVERGTAPTDGPSEVPAAMLVDDSGARTPEEAVLVEIRNVLEKDTNDRPYMVFSHDYDVVVDWTGDAPRRGFRDEESYAGRAADALTQTFESGLRARRDRQRVAGWDEGDLAPELLGEWSTGAIASDEIYEQLIAVDDRAVAVAVMLDCSGSMRGPPATLARRTAIAMHRALATCQLAHEITGFATVYSSQVSGDRAEYPHEWLDASRAKDVHQSFERARQHLREAHARGVDVTQFARIVAQGEWRDDADATLCAPIYGVFKAFGSDDPRNLMRVVGTTANLDGEAVMWQARRLARRPEPRRVMFVLSDGEPSGSRSDVQGARYLRESVRRCVDAGIEVYGIGMQSTEVRRFYPTSWVASTMEELTDVALGALVEALTENRQERAEVRL